MRAALCLLVLLIATSDVRAGEAAGDYPHRVEVPRPPGKDGKPAPPAVAQLWLPPGQVRGLLVAGKVLLEGKICRDAAIRAACSEGGLGVLYFEPHLSGVFNYAANDCEDNLLKALAGLAAASGKPEVEHVPWLTMGHSTAGIFARNVAYWKPERVIGVIHIKSGNFQDGIQDAARSLAGVPFLAVNGEFEEFGPAGGDLKGGLRSQYSLNEGDKSKRNQSQWVLIRTQIAERRRKNADNLMSLVVHRGGSHTNWDATLTALCAQFIRSCAATRLPATGTGPLACKPLKHADGWLTDADLKAPRHPAAPAGAYAGNPSRAFWHVDEAMAKAWSEYHAGPWTDADPTAGKPDEERWVPPKMLRDAIDGATP